VTESFGRYISAIYADRFDSYAGQKLQVIGEQPAVAGIMVRSQIVKANGEPVNVDYMMPPHGDSWLISDIISTARSAKWRPAAPSLPRSGRARASTADRSAHRKADMLHRDTGKGVVAALPGFGLPPETEGYRCPTC